MAELNGFKELTFIEQIGVLNRIESDMNFDALSELFEIYNNPIGDKPVDAMVEHTLRGLLNENEEQVIKGIREGSDKAKWLCLQISGIKKMKDAAPAIIQLVESLPQESDVLEPAFLAMAELNEPAFLDLYRAHMKHEDQLVSAVSIEQLGLARDVQSLGILKSIIDDAEKRRNYEKCSLQTAKAIEAVGNMADPGARAYLVEKIHHRSPAARRFILGELIKQGEAVLPLLEKLFDGNDVDEKIMAADVIGGIGSRKGAKIMVAALDNGAAQHPNIRFAIYEALGNIQSSRGNLVLLDALESEEDACLIAVISALEKQFSAVMTEKIKAVVSEDTQRARSVIRTIVLAGAVRIFEALYQYLDIAERIIEAIPHCKSPDIVKAFIEILESVDDPRVPAHLEILRNVSTSTTNIKILAVDDSSSMLTFYRSVGGEFGLDIVTAENGKEALEILESGENIKLVISDMNMPVMDGVSLTQKVRENEQLKTIPIIMATTESDKSQVRVAKKSGVNDFITKPIQLNVLEKKMKKLITF